MNLKTQNLRQSFTLFSLLILFCLLTLSGCVNLVEKGDELYSKELYEDSARLYEQALRRNPNNADAKVRLNKARVKIMERDLRDVKALRMGKNLPAAAEKLERVLANQDKWRMPARGALINAQLAEIKWAKNWIVKKARTQAQSDMPDTYSLFQDQYKYLLGTASGETLDRLSAQVTKKGKQKCQNLSRLVKQESFFLSEIVQAYCGQWGASPRFTLAARDSSRFNDVEVRNRIYTRIDNESTYYLDDLSRRLGKELETSLWFSDRGTQKMKIRLHGDVRYDYEVERVIRSILYDVIEKVKQGNGATVDVKKQRKHEYYVKVHREKLTFDVHIEADVKGQAATYKNRNVEEYVSESHNERFDRARLVPQPERLFDKRPWLDAQFKVLKDGFNGVLDERWSNYYCRASSSNSAEQAENIARCARKNPNHQSVSRWFRNNFGLDYGQMKSLGRL